MWCRNCSHETKLDICELCNQFTEPVVPTEVYWCAHCNIPIIKEVNDSTKNRCPLCGHEIKYLASDLRPVFPEERLLVETLFDEPLKYKEYSVWANNNRYYFNGKSKGITSKYYNKYSPDYINAELEKHRENNSYDSFNEYISLFVKANQSRLNCIIDEAHRFIRTESEKYSIEKVVISFSGGKDSTVVADLTVKALSEPSLVYIFGNTTLEFPTTIEYAERFRRDNPKAIFRIAKNNEQDFMKVCEDIGPPARMMRWS
jgi:phosphoadenosine phosphosulfate reductase